MSEEAKEKTGAGKAAHRKKKGKKVGEQHFFVWCLLLLSCLELLDGGH